ncbi:MAG: LysE family translocator [Acidimicrobiia bacterium]|jgi:threonine/homoserine/homoserine lactone efflux protein
MGPAFLLTSLIVVVVPGTGVIYTVSVALARGRRQGIIAAFGCTLGIVPHLVAAVFGLSAFLQTGALAFRTLKYVGVVYLLFLSFTMIRSESKPTTTEAPERAAASVIGRGVLLNLLNPKLTLFFFAFLPQFLSRDASLASLLGLGLVFMAMTLAVFAVYATLAARLGETWAASTRIRRRVERSMGLLLAGFAVKLALTEN